MIVVKFKFGFEVEEKESALQGMIWAIDSDDEPRAAMARQSVTQAANVEAKHLVYDLNKSFFNGNRVLSHRPQSGCLCCLVEEAVIFDLREVNAVAL